MRHVLDQGLRAVKQLPMIDRREIEILASLPRHEHVVAYFGTQKMYGNMWIIMELCDGTVLGALNDLYPKRRVVLNHVLSGLAHLHTHNILHRDLKSANVLIKNERVEQRVEQRFLLGDLGHARCVSQYLPTRRSTAGHVVYRAPEVQGGKPYGASADVWSAGCLCLELATGMSCDHIVDNHRHDYQKTIAWWLCTAEGRETIELECKDDFTRQMVAMLQDDPLMRPKAHEMSGLTLRPRTA